MKLQWNDCSQLSFGYKDGVIMSIVDMKDNGFIGITTYKDRTPTHKYTKLPLTSRTLDETKEYAETLASKKFI